MKSKKTPAVIVFIVLYLAYTATYIARLNLSVAKPALENMEMLTTVQLAIMGSVFSVVYACGRLLNGTIGDKVKPWIMVSAGLFLAGVCNVTIGFFPSFAGMLIFWGVNAFAQSMLWSSILCIIAAMYEPDVAKKKTTFMVTSVATGNILGILVTSFLINNFGVRFAFIIPGAITLILGFLVAITANNIQMSEKQVKKTHIPIYKLILRRDILVMIAPAMFHGAMKDNISLFMAAYFVDRFSIDPTLNPLYILFIPIIGFLGRSVYSVFFKMCKYNENKVSILGFAACAAFSIPLSMNLGNAVTATVCLSMIYAFVSVINTSMLSIYPMQFAKYGNVSSVSGVMDFLTYLGHSISSAIYGFIIIAFGYSSMYMTWIVLSVIGLLILAGEIYYQSRKKAQISI